MESRICFKCFIEYLKSIFLITFITAILVALICFMANWCSMESYSKGLMYSGVLFMIFGIVSIRDIDEFTGKLNFNQREHIDILEPIQININDSLKILNKNSDFFIIMNFIGVALIMLSFIIWKVLL